MNKYAIETLSIYRRSFFRDACDNFATTFHAAQRAELVVKYDDNDSDDGRLGRIFELCCCAQYSHKVRVSAQGKRDTVVKVNGKWVSAECKTNGGRIAALREKNAPKFVIYYLNVTMRHVAGKKRPEWYEQREVLPCLIPTEIFLEAVDKLLASKSTGGRNPEEAVRPDSKGLYEALKKWPVPYVPGLEYNSSDFAGLSLYDGPQRTKQAKGQGQKKA